MAALLAQLAAAQRARQTEASGVPVGCVARVLAAFGRKPAAPREAAGPEQVPEQARPGSPSR